MKVKISNIFDLIGENHLFTEEYIYNHQGNFPVYSATLNKPVGFVSNYSFETEMLLIVNYGDAGKTTYLNKHKFNIGRNVSGIIPKIEFMKYINLEFMKYLLEPILTSYLVSSNMGAMSQSTIKDIEFELPLDNLGNIDLEFQNNFVKKYKKITLYKNKIEKIINQLNSILNKEINIEKYTIKKIEEIAILNKGSNKISEENIYKNYDSKGIPVYSSATLNDGIMGRISKEYYESFDKQGKAEELTWTTNGYAGVVFYRETDYLYSEKCGRIILRKEFKEKINPKFLKIYLNQITYKYKTSESNNGKLDILHMLNVPIKLPIDKDGNIDLEIQDSIVKKYQDLDDLKNRLITILKKCNNIINND